MLSLFVLCSGVNVKLIFMNAKSAFEVVGNKGTSRQCAYIPEKSFRSDPIEGSFYKETRKKSYIQNATPILSYSESWLRTSPFVGNIIPESLHLINLIF